MTYDDEGGKYLVTGTIHGKPFKKVVEALDAADAADHCAFFLMYQLQNIQVKEVTNEVKP